MPILRNWIILFYLVVLVISQLLWLPDLLARITPGINYKGQIYIHRMTGLDGRSYVTVVTTPSPDDVDGALKHAFDGSIDTYLNKRIHDRYQPELSLPLEPTVSESVFARFQSRFKDKIEKIYINQFPHLEDHDAELLRKLRASSDFFRAYTVAIFSDPDPSRTGIRYFYDLIRGRGVGPHGDKAQIEAGVRVVLPDANGFVPLMDFWSDQVDQLASELKAERPAGTKIHFFEVKGLLSDPEPLKPVVFEFLDLFSSALKSKLGPDTYLLLETSDDTKRNGYYQKSGFNQVGGTRRDGRFQALNDNPHKSVLMQASIEEFSTNIVDGVARWREVLRKKRQRSERVVPSSAPVCKILFSSDG